MKIYTKTGDKGKTSLLGGTRVSKSDKRIEAYGTVDELNSIVGMVRDLVETTDIRTTLIDIQNKLFVMGSILATESGESKFNKIKTKIENQDVEKLEQEMDRMDQMLPELRSFILPGGHPTVSYCHLARVVCRRAERRVIELSEQDPVDELIAQYLNRLSDYFFILSRWVSHDLGAEEIPWKS